MQRFGMAQNAELKASKSFRACDAGGARFDLESAGAHLTAQGSGSRLLLVARGEDLSRAVTIAWRCGRRDRAAIALLPSLSS